LWTGDQLAAFKTLRGFDWTGFGGYLATLQSRGTSINLGSFAPIADIRQQVLGMENRAPTRDELQREQDIMERAMQQGAFGFATALIYPPASYTTPKSSSPSPASRRSTAASTSRTFAARASA